jgi:hypothetical protein
MKTLFSAAATSLMLLTCATAHAASTVDLTVKGLIVPSACTPNLSGGGVIDHGKISAKDLRPDNPTHIGKNVMTIAVVCDGATSFALNAIDNRADSAIMASLFVQVETIASGDGGNTWYKEKFWDPGLYMSVATTDDTTQPVPVKELVMEMEVSTSIARTDSLDLSNEVTLDGSATLEVKYL